MKHVFVVNPCAGGHDSSVEVAAAVAGLGVDAEVYCTTAPRDATRFVAEWLDSHAGEPARFYACGGDGTLGEVASALVGREGAELACYPCGSGNDFVRCWPEADFRNLAAQVAASAEPVDVLRYVADGGEPRYAVNTFNFGFEAAVCRSMDELRRHPLLGGRLAYTSGIVRSLARFRNNRCTVYVNGAIWYDAHLLLLSVSNGQWAGGGYHCAPRSVVDDGRLNVMAVKPMSVLRFANLIKYYRNGQLLDREELNNVVRYSPGTRVVIDAGEDCCFAAADGEVFDGRHFEVECLPAAIRFAVPTTKLP